MFHRLRTTVKMKARDKIHSFFKSNHGLGQYFSNFSNISICWSAGSKKKTAEISEPNPQELLFQLGSGLRAQECALLTNFPLLLMLLVQEPLFANH